MAAGQFQTIIASPPQSQWPELRLPVAGVVQRLDGINMPGLTSLTCDNQTLRSLPWNDLKSLNKLNATASGLTQLDLWRLPNLQSCIASSCPNLTQVDAHSNANLTELNVQSSPLLATINIASCPNLKYLYANSCALSANTITQLFSTLLSNGATNGRLEIAGTGNAAPGSGASMMKSVLVSKGWTVVTN